ncbi:peptidoglycan editing factor PgeF [Tangfeifania diversioriginum]|nr:peptidoglycan editing factor PgeF [Tangfeifania diversioriginum]
MDKSKLITYQKFGPYSNLIAFSTTKSTFSGRSNLRFTGNEPGLVQKKREQLANVLDINACQLVFPRQTHTNCVVNLNHIPENEISETDALVTNQPGICLCVQTADCVPVLLFDPDNRAIAAVHAGWRGTVTKIATLTVKKMNRLYGSLPQNLLAVIGPSIGPEVYEVGSEVVKEVRQNIPNPEKTLHKNPTGSFHLNLWEANRQLVLAAGLSNENIEISGECTFKENKKYYSARREGIETGRIVSGIMLC